MPPSDRYSRLAPLRMDERFRIMQRAVHFFNPVESDQMLNALGRPPVAGRLELFSGCDFLEYLKRTNPTTPWDRYLHRLEELLADMSAAKLLKEMGHTGSPFLGQKYGLLRELTELEKSGWLWLAPALGAEFLRQQYATVTAQICGRDQMGVERAGTALVIAPNWLLTCAHVMRDMTIASTQAMFGRTYTVVRQLAHPKADVAVIEVRPALPSLPGLSFRNPRLTEDVFTLGFPRIPLSREPALVMHKGDVTAETVTTLDGRQIFLYSAMARPGNSGGPVIAATGHVVGIVSEQLAEQREAQSPFFAGVSTAGIERAMAELEPALVLAREHYL